MTKKYIKNQIITRVIILIGGSQNVQRSGTSTPRRVGTPTPKVQSSDKIEDAFSKLGLEASQFSLSGGSQNPFTGQMNMPEITKKDNPFAAGPPKKTLNQLVKKEPPAASFQIGGQAPPPAEGFDAFLSPALSPNPAPPQTPGGGSNADPFNDMDIFK